MTPIEMALAAIDAMNQSSACGVILTFPRGKKPRTFPRGETLNEMRRNGVVEITYNFPDPVKIIEWLCNNDCITMRKNLNFYVIEHKGDMQ